MLLDASLYFLPTVYDIMPVSFFLCSTLENYFKWHLATAYIPYLGDDLISVYYQFQKLVRGEGQPERFLTCIAVIERVAPMPLAHLFTNYILPPGTKDDMRRLITSIKDAFVERLMANEWLDDTTRQRSIWKVNQCFDTMEKDACIYLVVAAK